MMATRRPNFEYREREPHALCPLPAGWRAALLTKAGFGPWRIELRPLLALALVREVGVGYDDAPHNGREVGRPDYWIEGVTPQVLMGFREGSGAFTEEQDESGSNSLLVSGPPFPAWASPGDNDYLVMLLGYVPPDYAVADGDDYVRAAERLLENYATTVEQARAAEMAAPPRGGAADHLRSVG